ncbi:DUF116 domain-containing protein [Methanoculleus sp. FWC-SCC1]|uniref:DUF116 domain-containing protein n=1 Tax=Methanoculleus frigidifontis TaxID=2584085 RepID=A0ABT8M7V2_9EURY|nr:DUF116 domain-containing protein [Methanoculleus sp. FWC-SCC1]MDN7024003.1 DUF116 domain-containing protein [Methanoculleus sp. FWC-SCC1]
MMIFDSGLWTSLMTAIGEITTMILVGLLLAGVAVAVIAFFSITNGTFYFPRILKPGMVLMEGLVRAICKLLGLDDKDLLTFFIRLHNAMNTKAFTEIPLEKRAVFLPQCLRSSRCPAHLTPEGLKCMNCGRCGIGELNRRLEKTGYRVFIVPGSTFIKRMIKQYRPEGIIGVGCLMEVKEGLDMCDRFGITALGVVTLKDGCVETLVNWSEVLETALIGLDTQLDPVDLHCPAD